MEEDEPVDLPARLLELSDFPRSFVRFKGNTSLARLETFSMTDPRLPLFLVSSSPSASAP